MTIAAIIQARMGSTRLPGKVLKDLAGRTVLARVVSRVQRSRLIHKVIVATSTESADSRIVEECHRIDVEVFRGDHEDVLDRYYRAAQAAKAEAIVRITADCPLIDPIISDMTIGEFLDKHADYASNVQVRTYPRGLETEVMTFQALETAWHEAHEPHQREHVTPFLYEHPGRFKMLSVTGEADYSRYRWTLDTPEDLDFLQAVYERFGKHDYFSWREVLKLIQQKPELAQINRHIAQRAVHEG